ncbi:DUF4136 domain-containing protein [Pricia sp. S334]|uniref:DUF4136 domain-containing protein n=1 Tax=Pricia mediterranea TaxID=3076079 RepID=A0ABU3L798_9FLAO|nr:DUF4136 domain-containing protein [Pricia sp. S334]MDT7829619.1 DUF4136 domain-containing protein [Pricia sp. S334]
MKGKLFLFAVGLLCSCNAVKVNYDYDRAVDFSNYTTYNYYPDLHTGLSELDTKRLLDAVDAEMQAKGIKLTEEPDFFINIESNSYQQPKNSSVGVGLGGTGRQVGGGVSVGIPVGRPDVQRQIRFDFVDNEKDELFWQAESQSTFKENSTPQEREEMLKAVAKKVLEKYPPE